MFVDFIGPIDPVYTSRWFYNYPILGSVYHPENLIMDENTDMAYMFYNCGNLNDFDVSSWNVSNVTSMAYLFYNDKNINTLDLRN